MNEQELTYSYLTMPEASLLGILGRDHKDILDRELKIVDDWIKNERCECAKNPLIKNKKRALDCEHLNKEIDRKIKKEKKEIEFKCGLLNFRVLCKSKIFLQRLHTFQI